MADWTKRQKKHKLQNIFMFVNGLNNNTNLGSGTTCNLGPGARLARWLAGWAGLDWAGLGWTGLGSVFLLPWFVFLRFFHCKTGFVTFFVFFASLRRRWLAGWLAGLKK